jgi:hypothetical protein
LDEIPKFPNFTHFLVVVAAEKNLEKIFPSFPVKTQTHIDFPSIAPHHRFRRFFPVVLISRWPTKSGAVSENPISAIAGEQL